MSVIGVGTDIVDIPAFGAQLALPGSSLKEVFTARERRRATRRAAESGETPDSESSAGADHLAAVWAIKEAFIKAWSGAMLGQEPPLGRDAVNWNEIEVHHDRWGRPALRLHGSVAAAVEDSLGADRPVSFLTSASHDGTVACALVVAETGGESLTTP